MIVGIVRDIQVLELNHKAIDNITRFFGRRLSLRDSIDFGIYQGKFNIPSREWV